MLSNGKVWILGIVLLLSLAYYRLLARPLFQQERTSQSCLPQRIQSIATVVWLSTQLQLAMENAALYIAKVYDQGILYRDSLKVIVNFMQIVGSFVRHACTRPHMHTCAHVHTCTHERTHARTQARAHTGLGSISRSSSRT